MRINLAVPASFGGGMMTGNTVEEALDGFLSRFHPDDIREFVGGYVEYAKRKHGVSLARPQTTRVALVKPTTATVAASAKPAAKAQPKPKTTPSPAPLTKRDVWRTILTKAGGDIPAKINEFLKTDEGARLYEDYQNAPAEAVDYAAYPASKVTRYPAEQRIEQLARQSQAAGETLEQAIERVASERPDLYLQHRRELLGLK